MKDVFEYAKYLKKKIPDICNTYDGNMKLQKLLVFADLIHLARNGELLFDDDIYAFENGCVVENVRLRFKNDYLGFSLDSEKFNPNFSQQEYESLNTTIDIFGKLSAKELSELNHVFDFWKNALERGTYSSGFHEKAFSIIDIEKMKEEASKIRDVLSCYEKTSKERLEKEVVNGITFLYDPTTMIVNEDVLPTLIEFSLQAEDNVYSMYLDGKDLVIY